MIVASLSPYPQQHITESDITFDPSTVSFPQPRYPRATVGYADTAPTEEIPLDCISDWYSYFNSRGYASVFCGGLGTRGSQGFNCCGGIQGGHRLAQRPLPGLYQPDGQH